jgi:hypothetical protein
MRTFSDGERAQEAEEQAGWQGAGEIESDFDIEDQAWAYEEIWTSS